MGIYWRPSILLPSQPVTTTKARKMRGKAVRTAPQAAETSAPSSEEGHSCTQRLRTAAATKQQLSPAQSTVDLQRSRCKGWFLWPTPYTYKSSTERLQEGANAIYKAWQQLTQNKIYILLRRNEKNDKSTYLMQSSSSIITKSIFVTRVCYVTFT
jgi:hypothetical protein